MIVVFMSARLLGRLNALVSIPERPSRPPRGSSPLPCLPAILLKLGREKRRLEADSAGPFSSVHCPEDRSGCRGVLKRCLAT